MAKVKIGQWEIEEEELEQQHQAAVQQGAKKVQNEPQAQTATYDATTNRLVIELKNGVIFQLPCPLIQGLGDASPDAITQVRLGPRGASLHWENLELDFSLAGLLAGIFGTQVWMAELGRTGGRARSAAKTAAARANGKKGGRPTQLRRSAA
ncbi:MAG: DUF2442 domain-containing protein [Caldilineaceae bacterium]